MINDSLDGDMSADAIRFEVIDDLPSVVADAVKLVSNDGEDVTYVHADHLGAPQKMTDVDRNIVWDASFLPFGEEDSLIGSAANDNRFPGQRLEAETGLHYNYYRDFDPTLGRYLQSDPIGLAGGINTYGYVSGNPVNYTDPTGELACGGICVGIVAGVVVGGAIDIAFQYYEQDGKWECIDWHRFAFSAAIGGVTPPVFKGLKIAAKFITKAAKTKKVSEKLNSGLPSPTKHGLNQKMNRGVKSVDELSALKNPLAKGPVKYDSMGRPSQRYVGKKAEVVVNPSTNKIVSVNPTSSKKAARLLRQMEGKR